MSRIPIFQMTLGYNEIGELGLIFSSETNSYNTDKESIPYNSQSIIFAIPFDNLYNNNPNILEFWTANTFYFPCLAGKEYTDLEAKIEFPDLIFSVPKTEYKIIFQVNI